MYTGNGKVLDIIGSTELIKVDDIENVPAKIDSGADSSSVWASCIRVSKNGVLSFRLFNKNSPLYTGKTIKRHDYKAVVIRNSFGYEQVRYRTHIPLTVKNRRINAMVTLSDRGNNHFPVLIGRRTLSGKFLIDVSENRPKISHRKTKQMHSHLIKNPYSFHYKYFKNKPLSLAAQKERRVK